MKYKNEVCRFKFGKFFSKEILVAQPLPESMPKEVKVLVLSKRKETLLKVKDHINIFLTHQKQTFLTLSGDDFTAIKSFSKSFEKTQY